MILKKQICLLLLLSFISWNLLANSHLVSKNTDSTESESVEKFDKESRNTQDEKIKEKASFWGLTVTEWQKYENLINEKGRRYWSPNLDPLTTLGVESETEEEREHYAKLLVKKEFERTAKELEFQRIYNRMFKQLYPNTLPIELDDNPNFVAPLNYEGERIVLFIDVNDNVRGEILLGKALKTNKEIDIYLLNTKHDDLAVQKWANLNHLPLDRVKSGEITLNHNNGQWEHLGKNTLPILIQNQDGKWRQIELGDL
ncbi:TIGR03759 family integrating conjugative element protein [Gilliamella sp. B2776]|uniref:TIGR03759 family integrating conjugative element protein n=1 Tax=unclassified Gilliamella TaxID=2685620 RepID=UPI00226A6840|nr:MULTISPECIES: TIGR03759 family integrating conjugative element protein [unclassified Gilliamella]MCX8578714.1 TIGR03759 family integrating conjugative element protein [Gilliamella sp. B2717]MCX8649596.1 TIGR03759 family integrating conjugative element protein [Gilliamella sp. B2779]MCX8654886.1 TIGR03759 family integrating conjugative element protein [Gilliamella sp. B2737]MCX8691414.1 TIGR03759 family integrating conjugative element protein [Gilliamella sp. B2776]MCX8702525.1 TIGR03759 fam